MLYNEGVMTNTMEKLLKRALDEAGMSHVYRKLSKRKNAFENPYDNSMWANMLDGALKGLEFVALATFDWKLTGIVKLLQSWIKDKREEQVAATQVQEYGANFELTQPSNSGYPSNDSFSGYY